MAKIKLNLEAAPETFMHTVVLALPGGGEAELEVQYIYRTKSEHATWLDSHLNISKDAPASKAKEKQSMRGAVEAQMDADAKTLLEIAKGWDLAEAFDVEHIKAFENKYPGAIQAIAAAYPNALYGTRLKN